MPFYHGVKVSDQVASVSAPIVARSGVPFVIGTAPVQSVAAGKVNIPVLANNYAEAVAALGYSDDWTKYTLCEFIYSHFVLYGMSPVIFLNVLDPTIAAMKESVAAADLDVVSGQIKLSIDAIKASVVVKAEGGAGDPLVPDTDYSLIYDGEYLIIEVMPDGAAATAEKLNVAYDKVKVSGVTATEIIGGYDTETKKTTGLECINQVMALYGLVPDIICAPGWAKDSTVAAAMAAKASGINGLFTAKALIDVDTAAAGGADHYSEVLDWKATKSITDKTQILCWPLVKKGGKIYHLSTHLAGVMAKVDFDAGGSPYESPSNKSLVIDSMVTAAGDMVILDITSANTLNAGGIVTALNFLGAFIAWGNYTACYPDSTDVKEYFIPVSRMFSWVGSALIYTFWAKIDKPMTRLLIDSVVDAANIWLNGLVSEGKLLGARVEFLDSENSLEDIRAGIMKFHIYITPPSPAQEIDFVLEYDATYVSSALTE